MSDEVKRKRRKAILVVLIVACFGLACFVGAVYLLVSAVSSAITETDSTKYYVTRQYDAGHVVGEWTTNTYPRHYFNGFGVPQPDGTDLYISGTIQIETHTKSVPR